MRVALFVTCLGDTILPEVGKATVRVLERLGHEVVFPDEQTCCGQLHANSGYRGEATALARRFVRVFDGFDAVVAPSSSCVGMVREVYPELARESGDDAFERDVRAIVPRVFELSELLVNRLGVDDVGASFSAPRHLSPDLPFAAGHACRRRAAAAAARRSTGLELVELPDARECCGFGGTFAVKNATRRRRWSPTSAGRSSRRGAEVCTAVDGSCLLQIGGRLCARGRAGARRCTSPRSCRDGRR